MFDKIVCFGKNYVAHVQEIGEAVPEYPVIFNKPSSALLQAGQGECVEAALPKNPGIVHAECELVFRLKQGGYRMDLAQAAACLGEVAVGLDMTLWDLHNELKRDRKPWLICKGFPQSAIVGPWRSLDEFPTHMDEEFSFSVEGVGTQKARGSEMMLKPIPGLAYISQHLQLCPGDLLFTGTPQGVMSVRSGQTGVVAWAGTRFSVTWQELA